ncbi:Hypothetical predicted protein, partial [Olea europaea subsp. europaea]
MAKEQQLSECTLLEEIPIDDLDVGINIMMSGYEARASNSWVRRWSPLRHWDFFFQCTQFGEGVGSKTCYSKRSRCSSSRHRAKYAKQAKENNGNEKDDAIEDKENNF